jgi:hypothetical protein
MGRNAVTLPHTKNESSRSVYHALQLTEQSARKTNEERTGIVNAKEDKRLNQALSSKRIEKAPNFVNTSQVKERGPTNIANVGGRRKMRIKCEAKVFDFSRRLKNPEPISKGREVSLWS